MKLLKLSKHSEFNIMNQGFHAKFDHSQLSMQKKMKLEEIIFRFLRKVYIMLQKNQAPYQDSSIPIVTVLASYP